MQSSLNAWSDIQSGHPFVVVQTTSIAWIRYEAYGFAPVSKSCALMEELVRKHLTCVESRLILFLDLRKV